LFVDAIKLYRSSRRQYFTCIIFDIETKQLLHLLFLPENRSVIQVWWM